ncbi:MAG: hypothetical protein LBR08_01200 [Bacteroidales bacterium]|nr:hypothetical protein [Bacteroidales bacterium]
MKRTDVKAGRQTAGYGYVRLHDGKTGHAAIRTDAGSAGITAIRCNGDTAVRTGAGPCSHAFRRSVLQPAVQASAQRTG